MDTQRLNKMSIALSLVAITMSLVALDLDGRLWPYSEEDAVYAAERAAAQLAEGPCMQDVNSRTDETSVDRGGRQTCVASIQITDQLLDALQDGDFAARFYGKLHRDLQESGARPLVQLRTQAHRETGTGAIEATFVVDLPVASLN